MTSASWEEGFGEIDSETRRYLYKLESIYITKIERTKIKDGYYTFGWKLTEKGNKRINSENYLKKLWKERRIKELYEEIKKLLGQQAYH